MSKSTDILEDNINELWKKVVDLRRVDKDDTEEEYVFIGSTDFRPYRNMISTYYDLLDTYCDMTKGKNSKVVLDSILENLNSELDGINELSKIILNHLDEKCNKEFYCANAYRCLQDVLIIIIRLIKKVEHQKNFTTVNKTTQN